MNGTVHNFSHRSTTKPMTVKRDGEPAFGNGCFDLELMGGRYFRVYGGPFTKAPQAAFGVCLAPESDAAPRADVLLNIVDFGVPTEEDMLMAIDMAIDAMRRRRPVYAGCMGGIGRTGTFIACLAKLWGSKNPVADVRANYLGHAVENEKQHKFIEKIEFPLGLRTKVAFLKVAGALPFRGKMKLLNPFPLHPVSWRK